MGEGGEGRRMGRWEVGDEGRVRWEGWVGMGERRLRAVKSDHMFPLRLVKTKTGVFGNATTNIRQ